MIAVLVLHNICPAALCLELVSNDMGRRRSVGHSHNLPTTSLDVRSRVEGVRLRNTRFFSHGRRKLMSVLRMLSRSCERFRVGLLLAVEKAMRFGVSSTRFRYLGPRRSHHF